MRNPGNFGQNTTDDGGNVRYYVRKTQVMSMAIGIVIGAILSTFWSESVGYGFMSGAAVSLINFQLMAVDAYQVVGKESRNARKFIIGRYILRYIIMFVSLTLIVTRTDFNLIAAFAGLFFIQIILVAERVLQTARLVLKTSRS
ncbi:MAG: ATP synthase subunit I [Candidatus Latescibacteria bacterium]|nr:ATP synthase subunit I [Candidatus Latescibacterota bacterium]